MPCCANPHWAFEMKIASCRIGPLAQVLGCPWRQMIGEQCGYEEYVAAPDPVPGQTQINMPLSNPGLSCKKMLSSPKGKKKTPWPFAAPRNPNPTSQPIPRHALFPVRLETVQRAHSRATLHTPDPSPVPAHLAERPRRRPASVVPRGPGLEECQGRVCQQGAHLLARGRLGHARDQQRVVVPRVGWGRRPVRRGEERGQGSGVVDGVGHGNVAISSDGRVGALAGPWSSAVGVRGGSAGLGLLERQEIIQVIAKCLLRLQNLANVARFALRCVNVSLRPVHPMPRGKATYSCDRA